MMFAFELALGGGALALGAVAGSSAVACRLRSSISRAGYESGITARLAALVLFFGSIAAAVAVVVVLIDRRSHPAPVVEDPMIALKSAAARVEAGEVRDGCADLERAVGRSTVSGEGKALFADPSRVPHIDLAAAVCTRDALARIEDTMSDSALVLSLDDECARLRASPLTQLSHEPLSPTCDVEAHRRSRSRALLSDDMASTVEVSERRGGRWVRSPVTADEDADLRFWVDLAIAKNRNLRRGSFDVALDAKQFDVLTPSRLDEESTREVAKTLWRSHEGPATTLRVRYWSGRRP